MREFLIAAQSQALVSVNPPRPVHGVRFSFRLGCGGRSEINRSQANRSQQ